MIDKEKILARIRKMLALAENSGATQGERENAMRAVHATLAKYNLDLAEVEASGREKVEARIIGHMVFYGRPWAQGCAQSIARLYFCHYIVRLAEKADDTRHYFIGRESNVLTTGHMAKYVVESIRKESKKRMRAAGAGNAYARSFAMGAAAMIAKRVDEMMKESSTQRGDGKSLVLASVYQQESEANQKIVDESFTTKKGFDRGKRDRDVEAFIEGTEYGEKVSLNRQVEGPQEQTRLEHHG